MVGSRARDAKTAAIALGVDVGATKVRAGLVSARGVVVRRAPARMLRRLAPPDVLRAVNELVEPYLSDAAPRALAVGIAIAAQVDAPRGRVLYAPNLRWSNVALAEPLARRWGVPVVVENDVRASAYAEWRIGAGRGCPQMVLFWGGTGLGGGVVADGRLLRGTRGAAGELGHLTVVTGGRKCSCPNRGCLEAYVGGWGIRARAIDAIRRSPASGQRLVEAAGGIRRVNARTVFEVAALGDPLASGIVRETREFLAAGAVTMVNAVNPSLVLLGGPIFSHWSGLPQFVQRAVRTRCQPPAARGVRVRRARLGEWSPVVGAALRAIEARAAPVRRST